MLKKNHLLQEAKDIEEQIRSQADLFKSPEGRILITGLVLTLTYIAVLSLHFLWSPEKFQVLIGMTATNILFGRATGMSFGYAVGLGHSVVIPVNMIVETILVMLFYPLFVFSWQHLLVIQPLKNLMEKISKAAHTHRKTIRRYGMIGLWIFVWFPFWMTGPVVGCVIGFLLGLRPWVNLAVVLSGTYIAITCWAIILRELHNRVAAYNPFAPMFLVVVVILVVLLVHALHDTYRKKNLHKKQD